MTTVLVTGVGGLIGQGILQALDRYGAERQIDVIGIDLDGTSHAKYLCAEFIQKPSVEESSERYLRFWSQIVEEYKIDIILPGIENDVVWLARPEYKALGFPSLINSDRTLAIGLDKYALFSFAEKYGIPAIPTVLASDGESTRQLMEGSQRTVIKPRQSSGSRGVRCFSSGEQLRKHIEKTSHSELDKFIIQPYLGSDSEEYSGSIFGFGNGHYEGPIVFRRLLAKEGYSRYVETVDPPDQILEAITKISTTCGPVGPTNFQFRLSNGRYYLMDVNPRFSSTTSLKVAFGFDEVKMSLEFFLEGKNNFPIDLRRGEAWRHISDFIRFS